MQADAHRYHLALGVPDSKAATCYIDSAGQPQFTIANQLRLPAAFLSQITDEDQLRWFYRPENAPFPASGPIINCCACFDDFRKALYSMARWLPDGALVFNHPNAVAHAASAQFREGLSAIKGLVVPQQMRLRPTHPDDFARAIAKVGLQYPLQVQFSTHLHNRPAAIVRSADDWAAVMRLDWPHQRFLITEMRGDDLAQHVRIRITFVGGAAEQVSFAYAYPGATLVKDFVPPDKMEPDRFRAVVAQIAKRVGMDHWTVELSFRPNRQVRLEHLWPGLPVANPKDGPDPGQLLWKSVEGRLQALLQAPQKWRTAIRPAHQRQH